jgi:hypothetical protein
MGQIVAQMEEKGVVRRKEAAPKVQEKAVVRRKDAAK